MKTAISVPDHLFRAAEFVAKRMGLSRSELYQRALASFLESHSDRLTTQALDEAYRADTDGASLDPLLERLQAASVPKEDW